VPIGSTDAPFAFVESSADFQQDFPHFLQPALGNRS